MTSRSPQRWARVLPRLAWKRPDLPTEWVPVLERQPGGRGRPPGYVWLDMPGKVRSVGVHELEFTEVRDVPECQAPLEIGLMAGS